MWVEDGENEYIYHAEQLVIPKKQSRDVHKLEFTIPIKEPMPPQYYVRVVSDRWVGCDNVVALSFKHLFLPEMVSEQTDVLGKSLLIYIYNFHVLNHLLLIYICKLHWNFNRHAPRL